MENMTGRPRHFTPLNMRDVRAFVKDLTIKYRLNLGGKLVGDYVGSWRAWDRATDELDPVRAEAWKPVQPPTLPVMEKQYPVKADQLFHVCRGEGCNRPIPFDFKFCPRCEPFEREVEREENRILGYERANPHRPDSDRTLLDFVLGRNTPD